MTRNETIQVARTEVKREGWPWVEPLWVEEKRQFMLFGKRYWRIATNTKYVDMGCNVHICIDDQTGKILSSEYTPTQISNFPATL